VSDKSCPTRILLEDISRKWAALVIVLLTHRPRRFSELLRNIEGISQKMLSQSLRMLERDGLVQRTVNAGTVPITVTYSLTPLGNSLSGPMGVLRLWAERHIAEVEAAQIIYDKNSTADST